MITEEQLQKQVVDYIKLKYPEAQFRSDLGGIRLTPGLRARAARLQAGRAWPDLFIAEPRSGFHGLFIEIKREGTRVRKKDGNFVADPHIREQALMLHTLATRGYLTCFGVGFDHIIEIIDEYMGLKKPNYTVPEYEVNLP